MFVYIYYKMPWEETKNNFPDTIPNTFYEHLLWTLLAPRKGYHIISLRKSVRQSLCKGLSQGILKYVRKGTRQDVPSVYDNDTICIYNNMYKYKYVLVKA